MNSSIKKIINVYQYTYKNYKLPIGFGDFLRGCLSLLQICNLYNIKYDMYINHPISFFLKNIKHNEFIDTITTDIHYFTNQNTDFSNINLPNFKNYYNYNNYLDSFINFCNSNIIYSDTIYVLTNAYPITTIKNDERELLQYYLTPTDELCDYINYNLKKINLECNMYDIIHVRTGDNYLLNGCNLDKHNLNHIKNNILKHINTNTNYIITSDNNNLNNYITQSMPNIKTIVNTKIHTGSHSNLDSIKNTLLDFYIMSKSNRILSFSVYGHGSSFSKWCSEIYNIPISVIII